MCPPPDRKEPRELSTGEVIQEIGKMFLGIGEFAMWAAKKKAAKVLRKRAVKPISFYF